MRLGNLGFASKVGSGVRIAAVAVGFSASLFGGVRSANAQYQTLLDFGTTSVTGYDPRSSITVGGDGYLYGTTYSSRDGGTNADGSLYRVRTDGTGYQTLKNYVDSADGSRPNAGVTLGGDGYIYGTTSGGGIGFPGANAGTIFRSRLDGSDYTILQTFSSSPNGGTGYDPVAGVTVGGDGFLYGTTRSNSTGGNLYRIRMDGTGFQVLQSFNSKEAPGYDPFSGVTLGGDGYLYGTTYRGGTGTGSSTIKGGTLYRVRADGTNYSTVKNFDEFFSGSQPFSGVTLGSDGYLYGTTYYGGNGSGVGSDGGGTVYRVRPSANGTGFETIANFGLFGTTGASGTNPQGGIAIGSDGYLYGTTYYGGNGTGFDSKGNGGGTLYRIRPDKTGYETLVDFGTTNISGISMYAGVTDGGDGYLYGTTQYGGIGKGSNDGGPGGSNHGGGTLFRYRIGSPSVAPEASPFLLLALGGFVGGIVTVLRKSVAR